MSNTNETFGDHDTIEDTELDAVTGGWNAVDHGAETGGTKANARGIGNSNGPSDGRPALGNPITRLRLPDARLVR